MVWCFKAAAWENGAANTASFLSKEGEAFDRSKKVSEMRRKWRDDNWDK